MLSYIQIPEGNHAGRYQGFYAGLLVCGGVCTAIIAIFAAVTFKLYQLTDLAM